MKSFTGHYSSVRGWALLLALLLGAGMFISACGDEEVPAPTTPAPPPAPPPEPPPEPTGPAAPENLRVSATTSTSITWMWDAVEGAVGYQGQFSTDATFTAADPTFIIIAPATSHTVSNLPGNTTGYFRVQSGTGTSITDLTYSEWSDGVSGATDAPPAATALDAPGGLSARGETDDSVTLSWDEVDDAESYEVEQRVDGASRWSEATCGDGGNVVEDTSCVASDLNEGTDYEFRVRGLPADDDDAHVAGAWSGTDATTTGRQEVSTPGGMGDLDVTWTADGTNVIFSWTPMAGVGYEWAPPTGDMDDADPCGGTTFDDLATAPAGSGNQFSVEIAVSVGNVQGLCVRTDDEDNRGTSFAWGVAKPAAATAAQATGEDNKDNVTTALTWTALAIVEPFEYEIRLAADSRHDNDLNLAANASEDETKAVQDACSDGAFVDQDDTDVSFTLDEVSVSSGLKPYTGYALCWRMANTTGATEWAVPTTKLMTRPGRPPSPRIDSSRTTIVDASETVVWRLAVRDQASVPRTAADNGTANYVAWMVSYNETYRVTGATSNRSTPGPKVAHCQDRPTDPNDDSDHTGDEWAWASLTTMGTDNNGISITSTAITRNPALPDPANTDTTGDTRVAVCLRAQDGADLPGPWVLSGTHEVKRQSN